MMKKALLYGLTAILLGTVTMVAPLMLLKPTYYELITSRGGENAKSSPAFLEALDEGEGTYGEVGALSSAGLMLIPGFLLALGVSLYLKKRMF
jgi:hypothetical protein